jgi:hypothetical protein
MEYWRVQEITEQKLQRLMEVRNSTAHDLLSLPNWDDLDGAEQLSTDQTVYEVSRIVCTIYSNAVFFSIFRHNGWRNRLTQRLRWLLSFVELHGSTTDSMIDLVFWSCFVAAIASYGTKHYAYFRGRLREILYPSDEVQTPRFDWQESRRRLKQFMWSCACDHGARIVWSDL